MDILSISYLLERICVDKDATFLQEDEVLQHERHDFSRLPRNSISPAYITSSGLTF